MPKTPFEGVDPAMNFVRLAWGSALQRLFSTFPSHLPGVGLLFMRLSLGITLIYLGAEILLGEPSAGISMTQQIIGAAAGVFLIAGLWTPVAAALATLDQIWIALSHPSSQSGGPWIHILLGVLCACLAMLGPGAWSVDARLFGRRRFPAQYASQRNHPPKG
jgi:putative oxidoreductase